MIDIIPFDRARLDAFGELEKVVREKFEDYHKHLVDEYTREYLEWCLYLLEGQRDFSVGAYQDGKLVGFIGALPRKIRYEKQKFDVNLLSFLTVGKAVKEGRTSMLMQMFDFYADQFHTTSDAISIYFVDRPRKREEGKNYACDLIDAYLAARVDKLDRIGEVPIRLGRAVFNQENVRQCFNWKDKETGKQEIQEFNGNVRDYQARDLDGCLALAEQMATPKTFSRIYAKDELEWELSQQPAHTIILESGSHILGFIKYHTKTYLGPEEKGRPSLKCGFIDTICLDDNLRPSQREALVRSAFNRMIEEGYDFASLPDFGYSKGIKQSLTQSGANFNNAFTFYMGVVKAKSCCEISLTPKSKVYMDVK